MLKIIDKNVRKLGVILVNTKNFETGYAKFDIIQIMTLFSDAVLKYLFIFIIKLFT